MSTTIYDETKLPPVVAQAVEVKPGSAADPSAPVQLVMGEQLTMLEGRQKFLVKQSFEKKEALMALAGFGCLEWSNKYEIFDATTGEKLLDAEEQSNFVIRAICKPNHEVIMHFYEGREGKGNNEIMAMIKPFKLGLCSCCNICAQEQAMYANGQKLGSTQKVRPCGGGFSPLFDIKNHSDEVQYKLKGPCCCVGGFIELCTTQKFNIVDDKDVSKGIITHLRPGSGEHGVVELITDNDRFLLELDEISDMDAAMIANILGTVLLVDYSFYENGAPCFFDPLEGTCNINCCNFYCCGCLYPFVCQFWQCREKRH